MMERDFDDDLTDDLSGDSLAAALDFSAPEPDADELAAMHELLDGEFATVTNPPGTITVIAAMDGSVRYMELASSLTGMTEAELAQELLAVARVAMIKGRAGQYEMLFEGMSAEQEPAMIRDFLQHTLGLPTPEQAAEAEAAMVRRYV